MIVPGALCFGTRRVKERLFLFKPVAEVTALIWYAFAFAVLQHGVTPHALVAMSNHLHWLVTDVRGNVPAFKRDFHRIVALGIKRLFGVDSTVFADEDSRHARVVGERGAVEKALYTVLNPVRAGLVDHASQWPGALWLPGMRSVTVKRPAAFFDRPGWPEEITIHFTAPTAWRGTEDAWHDELSRMVTDEEAKARRERTEQGRTVLGAKRARQRHHLSQPATEEPRRPALKPLIAAGGDSEAMAEAVLEHVNFQRAYRAALIAWRNDKTTRFPVGSYWMVLHHGAQLAA